jgi:beta-glucosidase
MSSKIEFLQRQMTLEEKLRQMQMLEDTTSLLENGKFSKEKADKIFGGIGIGCVQTWQIHNLGKDEIANFVYDLQEYLKTNTRPGIPALIVAESLHGVQVEDMTVFPQIIGLSSSWDEDLVEDVARAISEEAESVGISQVFAPDLDLAREPRWGRVEETYGEDPYLTAKLGARYTRGIRHSGKIAATLKHFAAHGDPENGINLSPVSTGERKLRELYLPPFEASIKEDPLSIMPAYSEIDGKPCHTSSKLLGKILRDELGFSGYTISDYSAIKMLYEFHKTAESNSDAGKQALLAGVDLEAPTEFGFGKYLLTSLKNGEISEEDIDRAVSRVLYVKERLGLLDADYKPGRFDFDRTAHRSLALRAAEESIVLLKNNGVLPIKKEIRKIAVIGPNSDTVQLGDYSLSRKGITLLDGVKNRFDGEISYCKGSRIFSEISGECDKAVSLAKNSDLTVLTLGGSGMTNCGVGWGENEFAEVTSGEGYDSYDLRLPPPQIELAKAVLSVGKPTILVLLDGRPSAIPDIYDRADAIVNAWYPGEEGGRAIAEILFGDVNPSGKLTVTIPKHVGQIPLFYNHKPSARGAHYKSFGSPEKPGRSYTALDPYPYFEFGFGLSYTSFKYSSLKVSVSENGVTRVSVDVENTGDRSGKEVAMIYVNDKVSSVTTPVKALKGFKKILLNPGERKTVIFELGFDELYLVDDNMKKTVEAGSFEVMIAGLRGEFTLSKAQCNILNCR